MDENKVNIPKIRFPGFTGDWEKRKLNEIAYVVDGDRGNNYPNGNEFQERGHTMFLSASNVTTNGFMFDDTQYITEEKSNSMGNGKLLLDDIVLTSRGSVGHIAWYNKAIQQQVPFARINSGMLILRSKDFVMPCFVSQFLKSPLGKKQINLISFGSAQPQLTKKDVYNYVVSIPSDSNEQRKVGVFFDNLDNLITLHQRKLEHLQDKKKGLLQKMFPKEGEKFPELRFPGFTDTWEQRKLGELSSSFEYGLNAAAKEFDGKNKYIRITDIDDETRLFSTSDITSPNTDLSNAENYILKKGDIVFARTGASVGKSYIYRDSDGLVYYAGFLIRARIKPEYDAGFIFQNTLTKRYEKFINIISQRSGQPGVNAQEYATYEILLPKYDEQVKIGIFFNKLDNLITLNQRKLEHLQQQKKGLLQQMFV